MRKKRKPKYLVGVIVIAIVGLYIGIYVWNQEHRPRVLDVYVFALKSGRSIFIRTPDDIRVLIDAGGNSEVIREITKILPFYTRRIDVIVATNSEGKNVAGLVAVLDRYDVGRVYIPAKTLQSLGLASSTDTVYDIFIQHTNALNIPIHKLDEDQTVDMDSDVELAALFPVDDDSTNSAFKYSKASAPELLFKVGYGSTSFTLLGDASVKVQKYIASTTAHRTDVLVVDHSALPANMLVKLIEQLKPQYLVYSKSLTTTLATKAVKSLKKPVIDPFEYMPAQNKLNIKKEGTTHFVSDGKEIKVVR